MASSVKHAVRAIVAELVARDNVDQGSDSRIGSAAKDEKPVSLSSLISTLVPVLLIALAWLAVFVVARPKFGWKYSPRSHSKLLREGDYTPPLQSGLFNWLPQLFSIPDTFVLQHQSLDAFLFLRLLKMSVVICLVGCAITWPILFPINATGGGAEQQLNVLNFGNVINPWKYFAHVGCAYLFFGFILIMITRESVYYINLRQAFLMSPGYAAKLPSRTVLYTAVPSAYLNEAKLRETLGSHVRRVWFPTETDKLDDLVKERSKVAMKLEGAETKLIKLANAARLKSAKSGSPANEDVETAPTASTADRWLTPKQRPTHKLKFLIGKKVDTIYWCRSELERLTPLIEAEQAKHHAGDAKKTTSAFVEFDSLSEAQAAYQSLTHHELLCMAPRYTGMHPTEIIWSNLKIKGPERFIRAAVTISIVVALVIFWSFPVAVVGAISNINTWTAADGPTPWLGFLNKVPSVIFGVISGLLPVVLLALLMSLLPPFLRWMAKLGGSPTRGDVEYITSNYYFAFQVVQVFLVTTLTSAASGAVIDIIKKPNTVIDLLSTRLPRASNFYLSYMVLQGLGVFAGMLVGIAGLIVTPILARILGSSPRKLFIRWNRLAGLSWGTVYPVYTNLLVIAIAYSIIAPLVTGFAALGLYLFYFAYRYNILFVYDTAADTKGLLYPRALQQLFVGIYIAQICIVGLLATALPRGKGAIGPFILMILLLVITALYHVSLNAAIGPLLKFLPKTLEAEERRAAAFEHGQNGSNGEYNKESAELADSAVLAPRHKKPNMLTKFLKPHIYNDYATMRRLVPEFVTPDDEIDETLVKEAYMPPSVWDEVPRLIVPRDEGGVSGHEVVESGKVVPITDSGATLNEKNKIILDDVKMGELFFLEKRQRMKYEH